MSLLLLFRPYGAIYSGHALPKGVRKGKQRAIRVNLPDVRSRESTAEFLKSQLKLRHPESAFFDTSAEDAKRIADQNRREKDMRDKAMLLAAMEAREAQRIIDENNEQAMILVGIISQMDDL